MEVMAKLKAGGWPRGGARVEETVCGVENPNGETHRDNRAQRERKVAGTSEEPGPKHGHGWSVERQ